MPEKAPLAATFDHPTLGEFTLDRNTNDYSRQIRVGRQRVELVLNCGHEDARQIASGPQACARIAARCLVDPSRFASAGAEYAASKLLALRNRDWLGEGERPLSRAQFLKRLRLESISVDREGGALWFDDGDVFWGHVVVVRFGPRGGFNDASVEG